MHRVGYKQKISKGVHYDYNKINIKNYEGSPFELTRLVDLPEQMPRIDQLVLFQYYLSKMSQPVLDCLNRSIFDKAYFLY